MELIATGLDGCVVLVPRIFSDARGRFLETWRLDTYADAGLPERFVQDNVSVSGAGVLRGLHMQYPRAQGKLVTVLEGAVFDVAVDLRRSSPTFGRWVGERLSADNGRQLYIPEGFAHGFLVLQAPAVVAYKCTEYYAPDHELTIAWDDPDLAIDWPDIERRLSDKDAAGLRLADIEPDRLPR